MILLATDDGCYNSFGTIATVSPTKYIYAFYSGTSHFGNGRIEIMNYDELTGKWSNCRTVCDYAHPWEGGDPRICVVINRLFVFFARVDQTSAAYLKPVQKGYCISGDLTCTTWSEHILLPNPNGYGTPWVDPFVRAKGDIIVPFWESSLATATPSTFHLLGY